MRELAVRYLAVQIFITLY